MFPDFSKIKIFIKPGTTDMRKAINGLSIIIADELEADPLSGNLFLFCNKARRNLKALYWDRNGFCLWQKKLEKHRFPWPKNNQDALELKQTELDMLLKGIDFWNAHTELKYSEIS